MNTPARFEGSENYVATHDLKLAVNAALTLQRPLLIKGEPGTGKTMLAEEVAAALKMPLLQWHIMMLTIMIPPIPRVTPHPPDSSFRAG
jgi:MoxR-like ATPase